MLKILFPLLLAAHAGHCRTEPGSLFVKVREFAVNYLERAGNNYYARDLEGPGELTGFSMDKDGMLFNLTLRLITTDCVKETKQEGDECSLVEDFPAETCKVSVRVGTVVDLENYPDQLQNLDGLHLTMTRFSCGEVEDEDEADALEPNFNNEDEIRDHAEENDDDRYVPGRVQMIRDVDDDDVETEDDESEFESILEKGKALVEKGEEVVEDGEEFVEEGEQAIEKLLGEEDEDAKSDEDWSEEDDREVVQSKMRKLLTNRESAYQLRRLQSHSNFKRFVKRFDRSYSGPEEYWRRYRTFRQNMQIVQFLRETELGTGQYGVTKFSDYTESEKRSLLGFRPGMRLLLDEAVQTVEDVDVSEPLPAEFDWRKKGVVTPVKDQGQCGSCWAFSVTGNVEGQWKLKTGKLLSLSEQELVDCDRLDQGCNGGLPLNAYQAIKKLGGLESEEDYHYDGVDEKCHFDKTKVRATIKGGAQLPKNETKLAHWLVKNGPISIGINANAMMFYMGGVSHPWKFLCRGDPDSLDHGVLIVGYGTDEYPFFHSKLPFWNIKNSWGENWGEQGYYRVFRGDSTCGVNQMATSAFV